MITSCLEFGVAVSREISCSPSEAWRIITEVERWPQTFEGCEDVERLDDGRSARRVIAFEEDECSCGCIAGGRCPPPSRKQQQRVRDEKRPCGVDGRRAEEEAVASSMSSSMSSGKTACTSSTAEESLACQGGGGSRSCHRRGSETAHPPLKVGSRYRIHRSTAQGERLYADWAVTSIHRSRSLYPDNKRGSFPRSVTFYSTNLGSAHTPASSTWTVEPASSGGPGGAGEDKCLVTVTLAIVPNKLVYFIGGVVCCCVFKSRALAVKRRDLEDMERRVTRERDETKNGKRKAKVEQCLRDDR